jgi:hypothetical protein
MSNLKMDRDELESVLHWRGKHTQAVKERDALQQRLTIADQRVDDLQSELTKARELLKDVGTSMGSTEGRRAARKKIDAFILAHQSAPAAKSHE